MDAAKKDQMRKLAGRGGHTAAELVVLGAYCQEDVFALGLLASRMLPEIDLYQALVRGCYMKAVARVEHIGISLDTTTTKRLRANLDWIRLKLIRDLDPHCKIYDSRGKFKEKLFYEWIAENNYAGWPPDPSGKPSRKIAVFKLMAERHPQLAQLYELQVTLAVMRRANFTVGDDGRSHPRLKPFRAKTGRNQPEGFIFSAASVIMRSLIQPQPGWGIAYLDYGQQEFAVAAALSGDRAMQAAYKSGDAYLAFAKQDHAVPDDATKATHGQIREVYKTTCGLGAMYGMGATNLALKIGKTVAEARNLLRRLRELFSVFWRWSDENVKRALREINASQLDYSTINMGASAIGFSFSPLKGLVAGTGQTNGVTIGYLVTGPDIIDARATISGSVGPPPGSGTMTETICPGEAAVVGCRSPLTLHVVQPSGQGAATITFSPVDEVAVSKQVQASGPKFTITGFTQTFSQVPEPSTLLLFGSGLLLIGTLGRKLLHA